MRRGLRGDGVASGIDGGEGGGVGVGVGVGGGGRKAAGAGRTQGVAWGAGQGRGTRGVARGARREGRGAGLTVTPSRASARPQSAARSKMGRISVLSTARSALVGVTPAHYVE